MSILTTKELLDFLDSQFKFIDGEISHNKFKNELLQASKDITINAMIIELNKAKVNSKENALIVFQQKTIAYVIAKITEEDIFNVQSPLAYDYISELFKSYESELLKSGTILVPHKPVPTLKDMSINYKNIKRDLLKDLKLNRSSTNLKKFKLIDTTSSGDGTRYEARWKDSEIKRNHNEYKKIYDFKQFELNHCLAYELAKRKDYGLYIREHAYMLKVASNYTEQLLPLLIVNHINEKNSEELEDIKTVYNTNAIRNLIDDLKNGKNLFSSIKRNFIIRKKYFNSEEYMEHFAEVFPLSADYNIDHEGIHQIYPTFNTPKLPESLKWEVDVRLNLALSNEDLMSYIQHIKDNLYSTIDLQEDMDNLQMKKIFHQDINNDLKELRKISKKENIRITIANVLFTYDCLMLNLKNGDIATSLNEYYDDNYDTLPEITDGAMQNRITYYSKLAVALIEKDGYKGFLDGSINFKDFI